MEGYKKRRRQTLTSCRSRSKYCCKHAEKRAKSDSRIKLLLCCLIIVFVFRSNLDEYMSTIGIVLDLLILLMQ